MFFKKKLSKSDNLPVHIGIIMDGNGRWAKKRGLPRSVGHKAGAKAFDKITHYAAELGIKYITAYTFSTENWKRPQAEIDAILELLKDYLIDCKKKAVEEHVKIVFYGDFSAFSEEIRNLIYEVMSLQVVDYKIVVNIAINYGGRNEIVHAVNLIARDIKDGVITKEITAEDISKRLYTKDIPDPDLIIRPSGEYRLSNFMLWQSAYSEFWFSNVLWPDFKKNHLDKAISDYQKRNRRFGGIK